MGDYASPGCRLILTAVISTEIFPPRVIDPDLAEVGRRLFARDARFVAGASETSTLPGDALPEIAEAVGEKATVSYAESCQPPFAPGG